MPIAPLDWAGRELGLFHRATGQQQNTLLYTCLFLSLWTHGVLTSSLLPQGPEPFKIFF